MYFNYNSLFVDAHVYTQTHKDKPILFSTTSPSINNFTLYDYQVFKKSGEKPILYLMCQRVY